MGKKIIATLKAIREKIVPTVIITTEATTEDSLEIVTVEPTKVFPEKGVERISYALKELILLVSTSNLRKKEEINEALKPILLKIK